MSPITLTEAQARLPEIIADLGPGEKVVITRDGQAIAQLTASPPPTEPRRPGNCKGMLTIVTEDEEHLKDFAEYME